MKRTTTLWVTAGAISSVLGIGIFALFFRGMEPPAPPPLPPLPADARNIGVWSMIGCQDGGGDGACRLLRRVINNETQRVLLSFTLVRAATGNTIFVIVLPPSVVIPAGVTVTPTGGTGVRGAVQRCNAQNCMAAVVLNDTLIEELSAAEQTRLAFVTADGRNVDLNLAMTGFAQAYVEWQAAAPAVAAEEAADEQPAAPAEAAPVAAP